MNRQKTYALGLVVIFCSLLVFPFVNSRCRFINDIESFENRRLVAAPAFDINHLDPFPALYDTFYNDHFNLRSRLIRLHNYFKIAAFKISPLPDKVVIGKDHWLFLAGEEMQSYTGKNRLTEEELAAFKKELEYRVRYLAQRNCEFYLVIAPCKASVYPEKIGFEYYRLSQQTWGQQLLDYLSKNSSIKFVNLFDTLVHHKGDEPLFQTLDNHWNELGGFYAANAVINLMRKDFRGLTPLQLSDYRLKKEIITEGNTQTMLGKLSLFKELNISLIPNKPLKAHDGEKRNYTPVYGFAYGWDYENVRVQADTAGYKLLIISDSFGAAMFPFLSENFSRTVKIFDAWQYKLNEEIVAAEKPDAVVVIMDEPIVRNFINNVPKERR